MKSNDTSLTRRIDSLQKVSSQFYNSDALFFRRRKDCLRQLLVVLCERGELQTLVRFPYIDLEADAVAILESRARAVDLTSHNYYDLLYAFHVFRNNYRKGEQ